MISIRTDACKVYHNHFFFVKSRKFGITDGCCKDAWITSRSIYGSSARFAAKMWIVYQSFCKIIFLYLVGYQFYRKIRTLSYNPHDCKVDILSENQCYVFNLGQSVERM